MIRIQKLPYCPVPDAEAFAVGECTAILGCEGGAFHISIAHPSRYPTWDEIRDCRYALVPDDDITMVMLLPPKQDYVNIHNNCFHLYQIEIK